MKEICKKGLFYTRILTEANAREGKNFYNDVGEIITTPSFIKH